MLYDKYEATLLDAKVGHKKITRVEYPLRLCLVLPTRRQNIPLIFKTLKAAAAKKQIVNVSDVVMNGFDFPFFLL